MARAYSQDLRDRVIDAALKGMPSRQTAARFGVGDATAVVWVGRVTDGDCTAHKQGQPRRSKFDVNLHREVPEHPPDVGVGRVFRLAEQTSAQFEIGNSFNIEDNERGHGSTPWEKGVAWPKQRPTLWAKAVRKTAARTLPLTIGPTIWPSAGVLYLFFTLR